DGARERYGDPLSPEISSRIDFELGVMRNMGFPGYFLIVQDFISAARGMGVSVGPGRGSAAGSVVAYCLKITDVDPLKYDLLFERFLNPDRISLPDIDVDFDDDGRNKVLNWVTGKYGKERVAHIITYGTMAAKSSIKDVARVQDLDLSTSNSLAKMVPSDLPEDPKTHKPMKVNIKNCISAVPEMKSVYEKDPKIREVLTYASQLEGTVRQTGVHACGVIIGADDLTNFAPLSTIKDKDTGEEILVTQYEGAVVEDVGLIKMDFLGLKTLSIIKDTLENVRKSRGETVDIDHIPLDDEATYRLFCDGSTIATFQFESPGMQKYLRELRPTKFEDLIAMNALYRPGPMDYIPQFINRKHGREKISYDIPEMENYLKETYGITVYQEQVMLLSRLLADFTRGESDTLRKAMGKKQIAKMMELKDKFMRQGAANGHDPKVLEKIWADWEKFASYAFNKSHATCYSWIAYQTAYLKAHYPAEFMAANLTRNQNDMKEITVLMAECKRMRIPVLGPDINESDLYFTVNSKGEIRFGLSALKGVGEAASEAIVEERRKNGNYSSVLDFLRRVNQRLCNRKCVESLGLSGSFESLSDLRSELFEDQVFTDKLVRMAAREQERKKSMQTSLFGDEDVSVEESGIDIPEVRPWTHMQRLNWEKELCGYYVSGHPLDKYLLESRMFSCVPLAELKELADAGRPTKSAKYMACMIIQAECLTSQKGNEYAKVTVRDYDDEMQFFIFGEAFVKYRHLFQNDLQVLVALQGEVRTDRGKGGAGNGEKRERFSWRVLEVHLLEEVLEK
ncbi:MAG: DNA polymerase III subunit alpha, partial [Bacteroidales bacterium]|nr:DNA polymerase III subunit alpha [Bacteroidales bacterium]